MQRMGKYIKIVVFVPVSHSDLVRKALSDAGCGHIGNYDSCSFSVRGIGRFRPLKGSKPFIGTRGKIKKLIEERIETICESATLKKTLNLIKKAHPYEEPVIDVYFLQ